jgi:16S rRNA (cytosine967-C5)-methyltransferase
MTTTFTLGLAARIVAAANRDRPADAVLKQQLKAQRLLLPEDATAISRAVFAYYRWYGWLEGTLPLVRGIGQAQELAARFAKHPENFTDEELMARAVPAWLAAEMEISPSWVKVLQAEPKLWLRARGGQASVLSQKLGSGKVFGEGPLAGIVEYSGRRDLFRIPEFHAGEFELQDISSQAVGLICGAQPGETWWDACSGEGGKTLQLSDMMGNRGLIWATDRADWRFQRLKRRAARAGVFNYRSASWNGGKKLPTKTRFDGVLVDAPCSGIGTWQRNPHARWTTTAADVTELGDLQKQLLANAALGVKPGGKLIYAVCTMARSETEAVANFFEKQFGEFDPLPVNNPFARELSPAPRWQLRPQDFGGNGMFVAVWARTTA